MPPFKNNVIIPLLALNETGVLIGVVVGKLKPASKKDSFSCVTNAVCV